jgi:hypothetical protein
MAGRIQLVAAGALTLAAVLMWLSGKGPGLDRARQAALLFAFAALVNWVLYFTLA